MRPIPLTATPFITPGPHHSPNSTCPGESAAAHASFTFSTQRANPTLSLVTVSICERLWHATAPSASIWVAAFVPWSFTFARYVTESPSAGCAKVIARRTL